MNMFAQCEVAGSVVAKARESRVLGRCLGIGRRARPSAHGEVGDGVPLSTCTKMSRPAIRQGWGCTGVTRLRRWSHSNTDGDG